MNPTDRVRRAGRWSGLRASQAIVALCVGWQATSGLAQQAPSSSKLPDPSIRIRFYEDAVQRSPDHYPALALLGTAYFEQARAEGDLEMLRKSREALERSVAIQPNLEAFVGLAELSLYRHRFAEAKSWAERAHTSAPGDPSILTLRVEARLGLGEVTEASSLAREALKGVELQKLPPEQQFIVETARGACLVAESDAAAARAAFERASTVAPDPNLAVWAKVRAAGVELDAGRFEAAAPLLEEAARMRPDDRFQRIHQAELLQASGKPAAALALYEKLIAERDEADLRRRAYLLSRSLGQTEPAKVHFDRCEALCRTALDHGEIFTLECLASLLAESGLADRREEARALARRNVEFKRDRRAKSLLDSLQH